MSLDERFRSWLARLDVLVIDLLDGVDGKWGDAVGLLDGSFDTVQV